MSQAAATLSSRGGAQGAPVLGATRAGIALLLVLAAANGAFLYLFPSQAQSDYAWPVAPPIDAAVMGAGYLAGLIATALALLARSWRSLLALQPGFVVLGVSLLAATVIHEDRFRWDYAPTILWTVVYAGLPAAIALLWWRQQRRATEAPPRDLSLRGVTAAPAALGGVLAAIGCLLFFAPATMIERWPWELTPLLARVFAGWYALAGGVLLAAAASARRMHELAIPYVTVGAWCALLLPLPALYPGSVNAGHEALWAWLALHSATLAVCAAALARSVASMRAGAERL